MSGSANDREALYQSIQLNPFYWPAYLILADWYLDHGEQDKANAIRWLGENKKHPKCSTNCFAWYNGDFYTNEDLSDPSPHCNIPEGLFILLEGKSTNTAAIYKSFERAMGDFFVAWKAWDASSRPAA
jgi:hypothetical protein